MKIFDKKHRVIKDDLIKTKHYHKNIRQIIFRFTLENLQKHSCFAVMHARTHNLKGLSHEINLAFGHMYG
jgi:hypothetical protein